LVGTSSTNRTRNVGREGVWGVRRRSRGRSIGGGVAGSGSAGEFGTGSEGESAAGVAGVRVEGGRAGDWAAAATVGKGARSGAAEEGERAGARFGLGDGVDVLVFSRNSSRADCSWERRRGWVRTVVGIGQSWGLGKVWCPNWSQIKGSRGPAVGGSSLDHSAFSRVQSAPSGSKSRSRPSINTPLKRFACSSRLSKSERVVTV